MKAYNAVAIKQQRGVALIIALMLTAIVAALSVKASWEFELSYTRSANGWFAVQQNTSLVALEDAARYFLDEDFQNQDSLNDNNWITGWPPTGKNNMPLPLAVEVVLTVENRGEITRIFTFAQTP